MADPYMGFEHSLIMPPSRHVTVTPHDTNSLPISPRALYVSVAGDLVLEDEGGTSVTYPVVAGQILPFRGDVKVKAATTATIVVWGD
jgi:hypothetical protein